MEYVKGKPYFCDTQNKIKQYKYLDKDIKTDILIVGGGIDGAILNYELSQRYDTVLADKSRIGRGCTSCATALLEYQLDDYADALTKFMSDDETAKVYKMGLDALDKLDGYIKTLGNNCNYFKRPTLLYTKCPIKAKSIEKEFEFRMANGFKSQLFDINNSPFSFEMAKGLYCENGGAELNPYLFAKQMIENSKNQKSIFENTEIIGIQHYGEGFKAVTAYGGDIVCNKVIFATGYNWEMFADKIKADKYISYTIVTNILEEFEWYKNTLIQDDLKPYHYMRRLPDGRIIYGGEDTLLLSNELINEKTAWKKYENLLKNLKAMFPEIADKIRIDYRFCGHFAATDNNLGVIGESSINNLFYFLSCGANGIINAFYGTELIIDLLEKRQNELARLFSPFNR